MSQCTFPESDTASAGHEALSDQIDSKGFGALVVAITRGAPADASAETLKIGGTGAALATMKLLGAAAERSHPGTRVEVLPSLGGAGGIMAVFADYPAILP